MGGIRLTDVEEGLPPDCATATATAAPVTQAPSFPSSARRRALLIGISYHGELLNSHQDVDRYRDVLIGRFITVGAHHPQLMFYLCTIATYGYRPEDILMLKDDPAFDPHLQPTRENIVSSLFFFVVFAVLGPS